LKSRNTNIRQGVPIFLVISLLLSLFSIQAHSGTEVLIGVLAKRGNEVTLEKWNPTADYLSARISEYTFRIVPLGFDEIIPAVERQEIDFVLANPSFYVELEARYGTTRIATLKNLVGDIAISKFGGVLFSRADRADIRSLSDLRDKHLAAVEDTSLGGFHMAWREMKKQGVDPYQDLGKLMFAGTHDKVVYAVRDHITDVGTVRTDTLERMASEGRIDLADFRIINPYTDGHFPFKRSTPLYPEWPFAKLQNTSNALTQDVAIALLQMPRDSIAAIASKGAGWTIPLNYRPVHDILRELKIGAYRDFGKVTLLDVLRVYWQWLVAGVAALVGMGIATTYVTRLNSRLKQSQVALRTAHDELEVRVQERTVDLVETNRELESEIDERKRTEMRLEQVNHYNRLILDSAGDGIYGVDRAGITTFVNPRAAEMLGWNESDLIGESIHDIAHHTHQDGRHYPKHECPTRSAINDGNIHTINDEVFWRRDGTKFPVEYTSTPIIENGEVVGAVVVFKNITERKEAEDRLRLTATVFENTTEGIMISDKDNRIITVNDAFTRVTGYSMDEIQGASPGILNSGRHDQEFYQEIWSALSVDGQWCGEIWNRRKSGEIYPEWLNINTVTDKQGEVCYYVGVFSDITAIKQSEQRLEYLAHHDPLTELPNRLLFEDRLGHALSTAHRQQTNVALLFLDLDRFKIINDTMGHQAGDALLQSVSKRLEQCLREDDTVARLGGDEFTVVLENIADPDEVATVAQKIQEALTTPVDLQGQQVYITTSIGISIYPDDGNDGQELIKNADTAMYRAKDKGRNTYEFYTEEFTTTAMQHLSLETGLRHALERDELFLYYQPQVDGHTGDILGVEALLRWQHPKEGLITPDRFIPIAEDTGLIIPIGEWVLHTACRQHRKWSEQGMDIRMAVNISGKQTTQQGFLPALARIIDETGMPPSQLELELTERVVMGKATEAIRLLHDLKAMGVQISIDDFGTGYSSLSYLKRFPIDKLKIDRSFIMGLPDDQEDAAICKSIIALSSALNLRVIAEGVETPEQMKFLNNNNCSEMQGYLFSKPFPPDRLVQLDVYSATTASASLGEHYEGA
jgi:diguanylate cyclase (GGDEF)-like protein/PAS domain S-box-containing protein